MKNQVVVTANQEGQVFISTGISLKDNKEYGYYRVESIDVDRSGKIDKVVQLSAIRTTTREAFNMAPLVAGELLDGKILIIESLVKNPFRSNQTPKKAGKDGGVLLFNGQPIYRETEFTSNLSKQHTLIAHTSVAAVVTIPEVKLNA